MRSALLRGAALSEESVRVPLRERVVERPSPTTPEGVMELAHEEAEAVRAAALREADAVLQAARDEGFAQGRAEAHAAVAGALAALAEAAGGIDEARAALEDSAVREATALSVEIAARLVRAEREARPERVADGAAGASRRAADRSRLVARVSPADLAAGGAAAPVILQEMGGIQSFEVVDDPRVTTGSCVLETTAGDVDATFESQLGRVLEALAAPPDEGLVAPGP